MPIVLVIGRNPKGLTPEEMNQFSFPVNPVRFDPWNTRQLIDRIRETRARALVVTTGFNPDEIAAAIGMTARVSGPTSTDSLIVHFE